MPDKYGVGGDTQYCYANSDVLINKLGITDEHSLDIAEVELTQVRIEQLEPDFDDISLFALCAIHRHLFQDVYAWSGALRKVDISKVRTHFADVSRIVQFHDAASLRVVFPDLSFSLARLPHPQELARGPSSQIVSSLSSIRARPRR